MKTVKLNEKSFRSILSQAERILRSGGIIVAPTDTVYGFIGDATNIEAIKKIFATKSRPSQKALPLFVKDIATARRYAYISDKKAKILSRVWPGPVTAVFHHKEKLPRVLTGGSDKIALRISQSEFLQELFSHFVAPLVQTSANVSGAAPAKTAEEVIKYFSNKRGSPDLLIDGGVLAGAASTVIDFSGDKPILLRAGRLTLDELQDLLGRFAQS